MSSNSFLIERASRRAIFIQRFAGGQAKRVESKIGLIFDQVAGILASGRVTAQTEVNALLNMEFASLTENAMADLIKFANSEAAFSAELFEKATTADDIITPEIDLTIGQTRMDLDPTIIINRALVQFGEAKTRQINQVISDGFVQGDTHMELVGRVTQLVPLQKRQAGSLVRTLTNATATQARNETMKANSRLFDGYEWVSTLDSLTSLICMGRDGMVYPISDDSPKPPAHWSCRSTIIPKVKKQFDLGSEIDGERPSIGSDGVKQVSGKLTYSGFLRNQSSGFQNEVLGPARAKLIRSGKLTLDKFVDDAGRTLTLDQLEALNPLAFE